MSISTSCTQIFMITLFQGVFSMSVWMKAFGTSMVITSQPCLTSMVAVISIDFGTTVGLVASSLLMYPC
jgi:hypothetical protein